MCRHIKGLREALKALPETLDDTYDRILMSIDKNDSQDALRVLQWLVCSARPVRIKEVAEAIATDLDGQPRFNLERRLRDPRDVLEICSSLITVSSSTIKGQRSEGEELRLAHFSVKEYLVSERIRTGPAAEYSIQEIYANGSIANSCLAYLLQFDKPNSLMVQTIKEFPLATYAAKYWTQHARLAGENTGATDLLDMVELFWSKRDAYVNCVRLFDPDEPWEEPNISGLKQVSSPLYYASLVGLIESTRLLLENGADVNAQGGTYGNALQAASENGQDQIVKRLLENGADVNAQGGTYGNALYA